MGANIYNFLQAKQDQNYFEICVKDKGVVFRTDQAESIFETFMRLHSRDEYEGTSMGLILVKRIADRHQDLFMQAAN